MSGRIPHCYGRKLQVILAIAFVNWLGPVHGQGQEPALDSSSKHPCNSCMAWTTTGVAAGMTLSFALLNEAWYADYDRAPLHAFNDGGEWQLMDKAGHAFSAYTLVSWGHGLFDRCGTPGRSSLWAGAALGVGFLTGVELLDGTSAAWGFSWWDMAANFSGAGLYVGQELGWGEQRLRLKFSAHHTDYAAMRPSLLGEGSIERYLKDYNGQTIWLSTNLKSFASRSAVPAWLNMAFGYGADGMVTASKPVSRDAFGGDLPRQQRFFLSPDLDLTKIRTRSKTMRTILFVLNSIKVPAPAFEVDSNGNATFHWLYF